MYNRHEGMLQKYLHFWKYKWHILVVARENI